jgi:DNA modification methylase
MCRAGIPQYIVAFRKPGENKNPVAHNKGLEYFHGENPPENGNLSHERWRRYASPVWMDVNFNDTLNFRAAREESDERHICPMSLDAIGRCLTLWSNKGDVVLSPFAGVGSEGYQSLMMERKYIGIELKGSYFNEAIRNLKKATPKKQLSIF